MTAINDIISDTFYGLSQLMGTIQNLPNNTSMITAINDILSDKVHGLSQLLATIQIVPTIPKSSLKSE